MSSVNSLSSRMQYTAVTCDVQLRHKNGSMEADKAKLTCPRPLGLHHGEVKELDFLMDNRFHLPDLNRQRLARNLYNLQADTDLFTSLSSLVLAHYRFTPKNASKQDHFQLVYLCKAAGCTGETCGYKRAFSMAG